MHLLREVEKFLRQNDTPRPDLDEKRSDIPDLSLTYVEAATRGRALSRGSAPIWRTWRNDRMAMSSGASAVLRALIARAKVARDRILLTEAQSIDWRSLTFTGERHHIGLRVTGRDSGPAVERMCAGLADAEFSIPGLIVADIAVLEEARRAPDGSTTVTIEALTVSED